MSLETESASALKEDCDLAARTALQKVQQKSAKKEVEQWEGSELENTELRKELEIPG